MQTPSSFNVVGPGGTTYFFRRTHSLPGEGIARPPRIASGVPPDPARGEAGYIMRKGQPIWGHALFDSARNRWRFVQQPAFAGLMPARRTNGPQAAEAAE